MGRNLYILAATIGILALLSFALSFTNVAQVPGSPGDVRLWRTTSIALVLVGLVIALGGVLRSSSNRPNAARPTSVRRGAVTAVHDPKFLLDAHDTLGISEGFGPAPFAGPHELIFRHFRLGPKVSTSKTLRKKVGGGGGSPR